MNNKYCAGKHLCDFYFCVKEKKCLWEISIKPKEEKNKIKKPNRVDKLIKKGHPEYCLCCGRSENLTFDHIIPLSKEGENGDENGQILCQKCNYLKGDKCISIEELQQLRKFNINF